MGSESLAHIDLQEVALMINKIANIPQSIDMMSGKSVIGFHKYMCENEQNRNIVVPHERKQFAYVQRTPGAMDKVEIDEALEEGFKNSSKHLHNTLQEIEDKQGGLKSQKGRKLKAKVRQYGRRGFDTDEPSEATMLKRKFKIANLGHQTNEDII
jgi:hypothetical protein